MHSLDWGVKTSFLDYLRSVPDHRIVAAGVVLDEASQVYSFASSGGELRFTAHDGALDVRLRDLTVAAADGEFVLVGIDEKGDVLPIARLLDPPDDPGLLERSGWAFDDVALTVQGSALFGGFYGPWTRMAPVVVTA